jgi:hypothetical protein
MKTLNYIMTVFFGVLGVICALFALDLWRFELGGLAFICFILAYVAWGDYKKCQRDEDF